MATDNLLDILHQRFREAFRSGQPEALEAIYSEGATMLPPGREALVGHEAILGFWEKARRVQDIVFEPSGSERLGDVVLRETGNLRLMLQGQGREMRTRNAIYLSVWGRFDGDWRLDSLMWRVNNPQGGRQGRMRPGPGGGGRGVRARQAAGGGQQGGGRRRGNLGGIGFGPRAERNRADQQAPMVPNVD